MKSFIFTILSEQNEFLFFKWFEMAMGIKFPSDIFIIDIRKTKYHRVNQLIKLNKKNGVVLDAAIDYPQAIIRGIELSQKPEYNCCVFLDQKCVFDNDFVLSLVASTLTLGLCTPMLNDGDKLYAKMAIPTFSEFIQVETSPGSNTNGMYPIPTMCWAANATIVRSIREFSFVPKESETATYNLFQQLGKSFRVDPHLTLNHC